MWSNKPVRCPLHRYGTDGSWTTIRDGQVISPATLSPAPAASDWAVLKNAYAAKGTINKIKQIYKYGLVLHPDGALLPPHACRRGCQAFAHGTLCTRVHTHACRRGCKLSPPPPPELIHIFVFFFLVEFSGPGHSPLRKHCTWHTVHPCAYTCVQARCFTRASGKGGCLRPPAAPRAT